MAVEAVDRAMRGQTSPTPIYEGEDGVIAWLLDGPDARYERAAARGGRGQARHPRHLHEGALGRVPGAGVDRPGPQAAQRASGAHRPGERRGIVIHTSHHTHYVIGSGANDPQKYDPTASRETLDHSIPYIFTVALQDGAWHHVDSYAPERAGRPDTVELWNKVTTARGRRSGRAATTRSTRPRRRSAAASRSSCTDGTTIVDEIAVADAHPLGARPFARAEYIAQVPHARRRRARGGRDRALPRRSSSACPSSRPTSCGGLTVVARPGLLDAVATPKGLF